MDKQKTCQERINDSLESTMEDLEILFELYNSGSEEDHEDLGNLYEYGLGFDYVQDSENNYGNYFRYQLSWGGPSSEFRIYANKINNNWTWAVYRIEYVFMDWFDGATRTLYDSKKELITEIFQSFFVDSGAADSEYNKVIGED